MENIQLKRLKPVLQLTFPKTRPEKNESNYRESLTVTKLVTPLQQWDKARNSVTLDLVHAQQELFEAEQELKRVKSKAQKQFKGRDFQWEELQSKEKHLRHNFIKFDKFFKENQDKRERAMKKLQDEKNLGMEYEKIHENLKKRFKILLEVKSKLEDHCKKYRMYEEFILGVQSHVPTFKDGDDIIQKHQCLIETRNDILKKRNHDFDELDSLKAQKIKMIEEHSILLLSKNSQFVELIRRYEDARNKALMWETIVGKIRNQAEKKISELDGVKLAIWDLYKMMCERRREPIKIRKGDLEKQAMYVKKTLWTLNKIYKILAKEKTSESVKVIVPQKKTTKNGRAAVEKK